MFRFILILALSTATGCEVLPIYPARAYVLGAVAASELPGGEVVPPEASAARWKADPARLASDVTRAVERSDWALLELKGVPAVTTEPTSVPMRAEALLPNNRVAVIHAWVMGEDEIAVAVMVGRFGDRKSQEHFLQVLADSLAGKPRPKRGGSFELP